MTAVGKAQRFDIFDLVVPKVHDGAQGTIKFNMALTFEGEASRELALRIFQRIEYEPPKVRNRSNKSFSKGCCGYGAMAASHSWPMHACSVRTGRPAIRCRCPGRAGSRPPIGPAPSCAAIRRFGATPRRGPARRQSSARPACRSRGCHVLCAAMAPGAAARPPMCTAPVYAKPQKTRPHHRKIFR